MRRDPGLAESYARRHGVEQAYSDAKEIINSPSIDAIYIATPPDTHKAYGLQVAAAGKPCCIEKPLAPNYSDCEDLVTAFEAASAPLFVAYYRRSLPRFNKVKALLEAGEIGAPRHINWHLSKPPNDIDKSGEYNWRTDPAIARGGYFDDLASHGLDLIAYLLGEFATVSGVGSQQQGLYAAFDSVSACWTHASGVTGSGSWNFGAGERHDQLAIYGSEGELGFSVFDEQPVVIKNGNNDGGAEQSFDIANPKHIQLHHVRNIRDHLLDGKQHPSTGNTALHTGWVMEQILAGFS